jgi:hypothetical protein
MIDFIGDIHGHAEKLIQLLEKLGYTFQDGSYSHQSRKVLFIGDYIDRGPEIRKTLMIVRQMVESGNAVAMMGNHEYNAICFHYQENDGGHLRKHLIKNIIQHYETLRQFQNKQEEYEDYIEWFKGLPLYYETDYFRAAHACWDNNNIAFLRTILRHDRLYENLLKQSVNKRTELYRTLDETLKGKEIKMPQGISLFDKDGTERKQIRIKWWEDPSQSTYNSLSVLPIDNLSDEPIDLSTLNHPGYYLPTEKPVFFGHYWLKGQPGLIRKNICCLDFSVAQNGHLAAYSFAGEKELSDEKFTFV